MMENLTAMCAMYGLSMAGMDCLATARSRHQERRYIGCAGAVVSALWCWGVAVFLAWCFWNPNP